MIVKRAECSVRPGTVRLRTLLVALSSFFVLCGVLLSSTPALAYPWMIRHEYTACASCHVDPSGAGLMTPYGRAQSEVLLRTRYGASPEEESTLGAFAFGAVPLPEGLLLQADVRLLTLRTKPPSPAPAIQRTILMQADAAAGLVLDRFRASASLGYVHEGALPASVTHGENDRLVSRQHWAGVALGEDDAILLRAGRMNLPYGLRIVEHTMWVRSVTRTDINAAQQHGVSVAFTKDAVRAEAMAIVGNMQVSPSVVRDRGYAATVELAPLTTVAFGASSSVTHASFDLETRRPTFRHAHGVFGRFAPGKPLVLMAEADLLARSPERERATLGYVTMLTADVEPIQGLHLGGTLELLERQFTREATSVGGWLTAAWFFLPHVDLRVDGIVREVPTPAGRAQVTSVLAQIHAFL
jgi:hypothetical protein